MASIYDLSEKELELKSILFTLDPDDEEDVARIALYERQLDAIYSSAEGNILWCVRVLKEMDADIDGSQERYDNLGKKLQRKKNAREFMKQKITERFEMFGLESVADEEFSVSYKLNGATAKVVGLDNYDVRHLPRDLWKEEIVVKPDMKAIKKLLKSGVEIDGLALVIDKTLRIY